jgi:hypothetical protein
MRDVVLLVGEPDDVVHVAAELHGMLLVLVELDLRRWVVAPAVRAVRQHASTTG